MRKRTCKTGASVARRDHGLHRFKAIRHIGAMYIRGMRSTGLFALYQMTDLVNEKGWFQ